MRFKDSPLMWLIAGGLATWRLLSIIREEEIAAPVRKALGVVETDSDDPAFWIYPDNFVGHALFCFWCSSVWVGMGVTLLIVIFPPIILPFALSAIAILIRDWLMGEHGPFIEVGETEEGESDEH